jgi:acetyl esterase/lipase
MAVQPRAAPTEGRGLTVAKKPSQILNRSDYVAAPPATALPTKTYVFKEVDGVKVELDVHRPETADVQPVVVWIHGGALLMGNRKGVPKNLLDLCRAEGYALVSIDYHLAPQVKVPQIIEDPKDAFAWIREKGAELADLDPKKLVVAGGSAGGYLSLTTGVVVEPRPAALVAYWGYGDVDGDWYTKPSEHYRKAVPIYSREEALRGLAEGVVTGPADKAQGEARQRYYHFTCARTGSGRSRSRASSRSRSGRNSIPSVRAGRHGGLAPHDARPRHGGHRRPL